MFDINQIQEARAVTFNVDLAVDISTDPPQKVGFTIVGLNSLEFEAADMEVRAYNSRKQAVRAVEKRVLDITTEEGSMELSKMTQEQRWIYMRHCIKGWYGFQEGGQPAVFTIEKAINVLKAKPLWAQIVANDMETEANFVKG